METFADYILKEENVGNKMEIVHYLSKREKIFFNQSVVFKTELARLFIENNNLDVDENMVLTACLLASCKKVDDYTNPEVIKTFAKNGAEYLSTLGFDKKFCRVCEQLNRYTGLEPREKEANVLEIVDQFGGLLLDRPERPGFKPDEALIVLKYRNFKDKENPYLNKLEDFVMFMDDVKIKENTEIKALEELVRLDRNCEDTNQFIKQVVNRFEPEVDKQILNRHKVEEQAQIKQSKDNSQRALFTEETRRKAMINMQKRRATEVVKDIEDRDLAI